MKILCFFLGNYGPYSLGEATAQSTASGVASLVVLALMGLFIVYAFVKGNQQNHGSAK